MATLLVVTAWVASGGAALATLYVHAAILRSSGETAPWLDRALIALAFTLSAAAAAALSEPMAGAAIAAALAAGVTAVLLDLRLGLVPDLSSLVIALAGLVAAPAINPELDWLVMSLGAVTAAGVLALAGAYMTIRRGVAGLGVGDVLLAAALGVWCAPEAAAIGVALGAVATLAAALARRAGRTDRLAFAPGLAAGFLCVIVWNASWFA